MPDSQVSYLFKMLVWSCSWPWDATDVRAVSRRKVTCADDAGIVGLLQTCLHVQHGFVPWWSVSHRGDVCHLLTTSRVRPTPGMEVPLCSLCCYKACPPQYVCVMKKILALCVSTLKGYGQMNKDCDGKCSADSRACYQREVYGSSTILNGYHGTTPNQNATVQENPLSHQLTDVSLCGLVSMRKKS